MTSPKAESQLHHTGCDLDPGQGGTVYSTAAWRLGCATGHSVRHQRHLLALPKMKLLKLTTLLLLALLVLDAARTANQEALLSRCRVAVVSA